MADPSSVRGAAASEWALGRGGRARLRGGSCRRDCRGCRRAPCALEEGDLDLWPPGCWSGPPDCSPVAWQLCAASIKGGDGLRWRPVPGCSDRAKPSTGSRLQTAFVTSSCFARTLLLGGRMEPSGAERWCRVIKAGRVRRWAGSRPLCRPPASHGGALSKREEQLTHRRCFCLQENLQKQTPLKTIRH